MVVGQPDAEPFADCVLRYPGGTLREVVRHLPPRLGEGDDAVQELQTALQLVSEGAISLSEPHHASMSGSSLIQF